MTEDPWETKDQQNYAAHVIVDPETRKTRKEICDSCEEITSLKLCNVCKCFMPLKTWFSKADCPKSKWGKK